MTDYQNIKSLLISRLGSVGDTIVALPTFRLIKSAFPNAKLSVLTNVPVNNKACALELILQNTGLVDEYIEYPSKNTLLKKCLIIKKIIGLSLFEHGFHYLYDKKKKLYECEHKRLARQLKVLGTINWSDKNLINLALTEDEFQTARAFIPNEIINKSFLVCSIGTKLTMKDWGQDNWKKMIAALTKKYPQ